MPEDASSLLRFLVETFFIVHGETLLNMICPIGGDPMQMYGRPYDLDWCHNLERPPMLSNSNLTFFKSNMLTLL